MYLFHQLVILQGTDSGHIPHTRAHAQYKGCLKVAEFPKLALKYGVLLNLPI